MDRKGASSQTTAPWLNKAAIAGGAVVAVAFIIVIVLALGSSGGGSGSSGGSSGGSSQVSQYYKQGYDAGKASPFSAGQTNTLDGNQACTAAWDQYNNEGAGPGVPSPGTQALADYSSGWVAGCEHAPYGQSDEDVPGSGMSPGIPSEGY